MDYIIVAFCGILFVLCIVLLCVMVSLKKKISDNDEGAKQLGLLTYKLEDSDRNTREEIARNRAETAKQLESMNALIREMQNENHKSNEKIGEKISESVNALQQSNEKKLDQMRQTVDEKLTSTLKERISSSFDVVGKQLESVHKSLGEMKEIAGDVSDLQRVLTNVKSRGTWAEVQLGNILEQTLTSSQYDTNVSTKRNGEAVEYAVKIPSREEEGKYVWLPIDSKFPQEDYIRLCDAAEKADKVGVDEAQKALEARIKGEAKKISEKYIEVPSTTNFAIMFLPTEGLYAEVVGNAVLVDEIQNKYRVMVCGPTTITAFLNTLSMGFKTIAIDKKAADVWKVLGAAKQQYSKFEDLIAKAKKNIDSAGRALEDVEKRNNIINRKLKSVEELSEFESYSVLEIGSDLTGSDYNFE